MDCYEKRPSLSFPPLGSFVLAIFLLPHLPPVPVMDEAVGEDGRGQREVRRHQNRRPDHAMKPYDVLPDDVHVRGPESRRRWIQPSDAGQVVREGVEPDVQDVGGGKILGHGNTPVKGGARYGQVCQFLLQPGEDGVSPGVREDEGRRGLDVLDQGVSVFGHAEKVTGFFHFFKGKTTGRVLVVGELGFILRDERFLPHVVPALILAAGCQGERKGGERATRLDEQMGTQRCRRDVHGARTTCFTATGQAWVEADEC